MTAARPLVIALGLWLLSLAMVAGGALLLALNRSTWGPPLEMFENDYAIFCMGIAFSSAGLVIVRRLPRHNMGWAVLIFGFLAAFSASASEYSIHAYVVDPGSLPLAAWITWLGSFSFFPVVFPYGLGLLLLTFPTGRLPSPRWRAPFWAATIVAIVGTLATAFVQSAEKPGFRTFDLHLANPAALLSNSGLLSAIDNVMWASLVAWLAAGGLGMVLRLRRSVGAERQQLKWLVYVGVLTIVGFILGLLPLYLPTFGTSNNVVFAVGIAGATIGIPIAMAIAIVRHRLYDIDLVIRRTFVYGALAVLITAVYLGAVVGIGALIGSQGRANVLLAILATAIVGVAVQPARTRLQHLANRLVFGRRATPYELLSDLTKQMTAEYRDEDLLPRLARLLVEATHAERSSVWIRVADELRQVATWPPADHLPSIALANGNVPALPGSEAFAVRHRGDLLGAITIAEKATDPLTDAERKVVEDLAAQAGLVMRNAALTADLRARLEELRASRQRLVQAQDEERRRLERDLHDGAQQHLVALKVRLGLARALAAKQPEKLDSMFAELQSEADSTLATMRELAHGIYPPLLAERGLKDALESHARRATVPVTVEADGLGRYPQEVESAVYFCCLEALQNVQKYAQASEARVRLWQDDGLLSFEVSDDGTGFDPATTKPGAGLANLRDRLDALGGDLTIDSRPGAGTRLGGRVRLAPGGRQAVGAEL